MYRYSDNKINLHWIYLDNNHNPLLVPCLFARYTQVVQCRVDLECQVDLHTKLIKEFFFEKEIGKDASYKICNHVGRFLEWIEEYSKIELITLQTHTALPNAVINEYINEYLIDECSKSQFVADQAVNSLNAYYLWLFYFFGNKRKILGIKSKYREAARNNSKGELAVKYLLPQTRELMYRKTDSLLEEIVLRNGGELGCRSKENQGFILNDYKANQQTHAGLITLFKALVSDPEQEEFEYHLSSLYTKYGRSRTLYIPRHLLSKMKKYYETERPHSDSNHLLLSGSNNHSFGKCISRSFGSNTFHKTRNKVRELIKSSPFLYCHVQEITSANVYHHLRHSFGTDFFYDLCQGQNKDYESIITTSAIYLTTAKRLGHKVDSQYANTVTKTYIHSCGLREKLMKEVVNNA